MRSHVDVPDPAAPGKRLFSRDCPVYHLRLPSGVELFLLVNHLKSQSFAGGNPDPLRTRQSTEVRAIYDRLRADGAELVAVLGDLNKGPDPADPSRHPTLEALLGPDSPLVDAYGLDKFSQLFDEKDVSRERPGSFQSCTLGNRLDYILLSPELAATVTDGGVFRKGLWGRPTNVKPPALWGIYPEINRQQARRVRPRRGLGGPRHLMRAACVEYPLTLGYVDLCRRRCALRLEISEPFAPGEPPECRTAARRWTLGVQRDDGETMGLAITAEGLEKRFGDTTALAGVDLAVPPGTVLGLLGPNGAGKTTAVRILATLLRPDAGHATVGGYDVVTDAHRVRQLIGLTGQYASVDETLTGTENLLLIGRLLGMSRARRQGRARASCSAEFELTDAAGPGGQDLLRRHAPPARPGRQPGRPARRCSTSTSRRPGWTRAAGSSCGTSSAGWSPTASTVLLTTQYLDEADQLADEIVVIDHGRVIATGTPEELKAKAGAQTLAVRPADPGDLATVVSVVVGELTGAQPEVDGQLVTAPVADPELLPAVVRRLDEAGVIIAELALRSASLDEVFLSLTGRPAEDRPKRPTTSARGSGDDRR